MTAKKQAESKPAQATPEAASVIAPAPLVQGMDDLKHAAQEASTPPKKKG